VLRLVDLAPPAPGPDEVLVEVHAAGLNPSDVSNVTGRFPHTTLPRVPGRDLAGIVVEGPAALVGEAVWASGAELGFERDGSHAALVALPAAAVRPKPRSLSMAEAAAVGVPFVTAWLALRGAAVEAGQSVVVTGANGAVGEAACQLAAWRGARVIPVVRRADVPGAVDAAATDLRTAILERTAGRGADACIDTVGGAMFAAGLACLASGGRLVAMAIKGDGVVSFDMRDFYHRQLYLVGVDSMSQGVVASAGILERLAAGFASGALRARAGLSERSLAAGVATYQALFDARRDGRSFPKTVFVLRPA
jgi:NADPH:quinone reductase-like Zn-dependent oxidoreductase